MNDIQLNFKTEIYCEKCEEDTDNKVKKHDFTNSMYIHCKKCEWIKVHISYAINIDYNEDYSTIIKIPKIEEREE